MDLLNTLTSFVFQNIINRIHYESERVLLQKEPKLTQIETICKLDWILI